MAAGFKWWDLLQNDFLTQNPHVGAAAVGASVLVASGVAYAAASPKIKIASAQDEDFVPSARFNLRNIWEVVGEFVQTNAKEIIGPHYAKYYPILIFIFTWTLLNNVLGIFPGLGSTTDNLNSTLGMALCVFLYYNYMGFRSHGFKYLEQFTGHLHGALLLLLGPVMFVIETISHMIRPLTLGIRLRTNIYADHEVHYTIVYLVRDLATSLGASLGVVGSAIGFVLESILPVPIALLGLLVCVIQAFVFTLLTMIYIGLATAHEEH